MSEGESRQLRYQKRRVASGRCARCGQERGEDGTTWYCETCMEWNRKYQREYKNAKKGASKRAARDEAKDDADVRRSRFRGEGQEEAREGV